jgi:FkbM family methyltransferase
MPSVKPEFLALAKKLSIRRIYKCGSRDALDGIDLARELDAEELHIFECHPPAVKLCRKNSAAFKGNTALHFNNCAVSETDIRLGLPSIGPERPGDGWPAGALGVPMGYRADPEWLDERPPAQMRVATVSLNTYCRLHRQPELLWLDVQGAELRALRGADAVLPRVKLLHVTVAFRPLYLHQPLFWDIDRFVRRHFRLVWLYGIRSRAFLRLNTFLGRERWFTDSVYVNRDYAYALQGMPLTAG